MDSIRRLTQYFSDFPGIGPRQAKRFVYFLLTRNQVYLEEMANLFRQIKSTISICQSCYRFFPSQGTMRVCSICGNPHRDQSSLLVVSRDVDLENIERTGTYDGVYFVLGGSVPILEQNPDEKIRTNELMNRVELQLATGILKEIILATNANPEGENTADYVRDRLVKRFGDTIKISVLGRGLSTGTELEYSDTETIKNALKNRG